MSQHSYILSIWKFTVQTTTGRLKRISENVFEKTRNMWISRILKGTGQDFIIGWTVYGWIGPGTDRVCQLAVNFFLYSITFFNEEGNHHSLLKSFNCCTFLVWISVVDKYKLKTLSIQLLYLPALKRSSYQIRSYWKWYGSKGAYVRKCGVGLLKKFTFSVWFSTGLCCSFTIHILTLNN